MWTYLSTPMWTYLPTPENSIAVWKLVGEAWGQRSFKEIVALHEISSSFAVISKNSEIIALANLAPIYSTQSAWLSVWMADKYRRNRDSYALTIAVWSEFRQLIFKDLGFITLTALTQKLSVANLGLRFGANRVDIIRNLYGPGQHGYLSIWD